MKPQSGFTLIEMVAVIIILAIMAATALPRFANLSAEARYSSLSGLAGGLRSAAALAKSKWLTAQSGNLQVADFNGVFVSVIALPTVGSAVTNLGYPDNTVNGINLAMDSWATYMSAQEADGSLTYWPEGVAVSSGCFVRYQSGTVTITPANVLAATGTNGAGGCT